MVEAGFKEEIITGHVRDEKGHRSGAQFPMKNEKVYIDDKDGEDARETPHAGVVQ